MKRVLLIATSTLFGRGIEILLRQVKSLEYLGLETEEDKVIPRIEKQKPDVVIIEKSISESDFGKSLRQILWSSANLRVIELDLETDTISIHSCSEQLVKQVDDLVQAIIKPEEP